VSSAVPAQRSSRPASGARPGPGPSWPELTGVALAFVALTVVMTFPLAFRVGTLGRVDNGDGQFSIWNVAWVARTLVVDPRHVFDANIFYPHRWTLVYSESNLGAGILAIPVYWVTRNPYAAHNVVLLLSFVLSATGAYALVRYLTGDGRAAFIAAIPFAFCPYVFAHTPHIQLLMTAGLPFGLLACHRLVDQPSAGRGVVLGITMALQALCCGYYAVFLMLMAGYTLLALMAIRRLWFDGPFWRAVVIAAVTSVAGVLPLLVPYLNLQSATGFRRSLGDARRYSADWRAYLASSAHAHAWILRLIGHWQEVLFPGVAATLLGAAGTVVGLVRGGQAREVSLVYGGLVALSFWASLGPDGGLYGLLYAIVPGFSLLRAPSRFGVVVVLALSVLTGLAISTLLARLPRPRLVALLLGMAAAFELLAPSRFVPVQPVSPAYRVLAALPYGAVLELPVYSDAFRFVRTRYMLDSTAHWMPLVDAYSDYVPPDFIEHSEALGEFPTDESLELLRRDHVRYAVVHLDQYGAELLPALLQRLQVFHMYLRLRYADAHILLYEITGFPA
jgi:hypothetical protein